MKPNLALMSLCYRQEAASATFDNHDGLPRVYIPWVTTDYSLLAFQDLSKVVMQLRHALILAGYLVAEEGVDF